MEKHVCKNGLHGGGDLTNCILWIHACRLWGKIFVSALEVKGSFDASSLTAFLWAATTAGVGHFKTVSLIGFTAVGIIGMMGS